MPSAKELSPISHRRHWYEEGSLASDLLIYEIHAIKTLFPLQALKKMKNEATPPWDRSKFQILTHELRLRKTQDSNYSLGWDIKFSMLESEHLCRPDEIWTLKIFYPDTRHLQGDMMVTVILDKKNRPLQPPKENRRPREPEKIIEGNVYPMWCVGWDKPKNPSELNGAVLATESILLLRMYLHLNKW